MSGVEGRAGDEVKVSPSERVERVLGNIEVDHKRKRGKTKARLDSLRLSTARMLAVQADSSFGLSEFGKLAIRATEQALLDDWEPMENFISMEITGLMLGETLTRRESLFLPGVEKLQQSLGGAELPALILIDP